MLATGSKGGSSRTLSRRRMSRFVCVTVAALALGACESTTGPGGSDSDGQIAIGTVVSGSLATSDSARTYVFTAAAASRYVIFAAVLEGALRLDVQDSARQNINISALARPTGRPVEETIALQFTAAVSGPHTLTLSGEPPHTVVRFQVLIYRVDVAPESRPAAFAIGDTVSGETIDPIADVDVFTAHAQAGQDFVVAAEAPDSAGFGPLGLSVVDSAGQWFGLAMFPTGVPAAITTGRVHPPAGGTYQFRFASVPGGPPPFHGAYRFWTYAVNPAPEHRGAAAPLSTVIADETLDRTGDVDVFTFSATAGDELNTFYQSAVASHLEIAPVSGPLLASVSASADTALFSHSTGRVVLAQTGTYVARISADGPALTDTGAYRFFLYAIDRRPETVPAAITAGDSVAGEAIDLQGDVDEFTFAASSGEEFNAFLQVETPDALARLEAIDADGTVLATLESRGADTTLLGQGSPRFATRTTGTHRLRMQGAEPGAAGPYRLLLSRVNRRPESSPDTLVFGDSVLAEAIDVPGDVDEYRVHVSDSAGANLVITLGNVAPDGHFLLGQLIDSASGHVLASASSYGWPGQSGALPISPGSYVIRVQESSNNYQPALRGLYQLWLYHFGFGPESVRDTIAPGDTVSGESLDVPGDIDSYHLYAGPRQHINVMIQGLSSGNGGFQAFVSRESGPIALVSTPLSSAALTDHQSLRLDLPGAGWYTVSVAGGSSPTQLSERGAYRLAVLAADTLPETASALLAIGDSLTTEALDFAGDWDQYTVTAPPGQELNVLFGTSAPCCRYPRVLVFDPETGDSLASAVGQNDHVAGPARVPASGRVAVAVLEPPSAYFRECYEGTCNGVFSFTGPYRLQVLLLSRGPETAAAAYALGDTVRTEAVFPAGDIDEFTVAATPGETLTPWWRLRADPVPAGSLIKLEVIDPATGVVLAGSGVSLSASMPSFFSPGSFSRS